MRQDRNTYEGGVVLYIRNALEATLLCSLPTTLKNSKLSILEYLMTRWEQGKRPQVFVSVNYRYLGISFTEMT